MNNNERKMYFSVKMMVYCSVLILLVFSVNSIDGNPFNNDIIEQCKEICSENFSLLPLQREAQDICEKGCRFFNLIDLTDGSDLNATTNECHTSCNDSYDLNKLQSWCVTGCNAMSQKKETETPDIFRLMEQETQLDQQDIDSFESDLLNDAIIRKQLFAEDEYQIPETYIRTMPLNRSHDGNNFALRMTKRWLCFYWTHSVIFFLLCVGLFSILAPILWLAKRREMALEKPFINWLVFVETGEDDWRTSEKPQLIDSKN